MPNQYSALTKANIERKINRKRNPVHSVADLAEEFGYTTIYDRFSGTNTWGHFGRRAPSSFVKQVKAEIGEAAYKRLRDNSKVNRAYR